MPDKKEPVNCIEATEAGKCPRHCYGGGKECPYLPEHIKGKQNDAKRDD